LTSKIALVLYPNVDQLFKHLTHLKPPTSDEPLSRELLPNPSQCLHTQVRLHIRRVPVLPQTDLFLPFPSNLGSVSTLRFPGLSKI
jgi:hypothetical protein